MEIKNHGRAAIFILAVFDILLINLSIVLAFWLKFGFVSFNEIPIKNIRPYFELLPYITISAFIIFYLYSLYSDWRRKQLINLIFLIVLSVTTLNIITIVLTFWYRGFAFPRSVLLIAFIIQIISMVTSRSLFWLMAKYIFGRRRVLIVGKEIEGNISIADKIMEHSKDWFVVQDMLLEINEEDLVKKVHYVDVALVLPSLTKEEKAIVINVCARLNKEVLLVPEIYELFIMDSQQQQIDDMLVLSIQPPKLTVSQNFLKRTLDITVSLILLIFTLPIIVLLFILIPMTSRGPALYRQERLGKDARPYQIYKFRSMAVDAERKTGPMLAKKDDPRITKIGKLIRATRLDEIPQLFNIIKGDMSLVGPRPERKYFIDKFQETIPDYNYRLTVKPGLTGLAQVLAKYSTTVDDKLRFDLMYVKNYSFALDIKIILQTIRVVLQRDQSQGIDDNTKSKSRRDDLLTRFGLGEVAATKNN